MSFFTIPEDAERVAIEHPALDVFVPGIAQPKGSKTVVGRTKAGVTIMIESADKAGDRRRNPNTRKSGGEMTAWAGTVRAHVSDAWAGQPALDEPVYLVLEFWLPRTGSFRVNDLYRSTKPDVSKITRCVEDELVKAQVLCEDSRIVDERPVKRLCAKNQEPGVRIRLWPLRDWERAGWVLEIPDRPILVRKRTQP